MGPFQSNQSAGFPARRSLACTVSLNFSPSLFPPSTSSQNFYSLNFLIALVVELNQLSVPASVCWNSQSLGHQLMGKTLEYMGSAKGPCV